MAPSSMIGGARFAALLTACLTGLIVLPGVAGAQETGTSVEARTAGYVDDDATYVLRPYVAGHVAAGPVRVGAAYSADVVSSASVDVISRATRAIEETRHQGTADASYFGEEGLALGLSWTGGFEPDHESHGLALRGERDLDPERLWHGSLVLAGSWARIGTVIDPRFSREAFTAQGALALARIIDASTVGRAVLEGSATSGYQSSPYRTVRLGEWSATRSSSTDPDAPAWLFTGVSGVARERHPELRVRGRLSLELAHDLGSGLALVTKLAGYADDWGVLAVDGSAELRIEPHQNLVVRFGLRGYAQSGAWFWRQRYLDDNEASGFLTADRELGPMRSYTLLAGISVPVDDVRLDARLEGIRWEYPERDLLTERHALSLILGLTWTPDLSL